jgi:cyanophycinase
MRRQPGRLAPILGLAILVAAPRAQSTPPNGHLVIVGGGTIGPEIRQKALDLSGGTAAIVAILPQASELPETGAEAIAAWKKAGAAEAVALDPKQAEAAIAAIRRATLIWFPGGDQNRLTAALAGTRIPEAILARYREGATVAGTSAGAAVMSRVMITGEADLQSVTSGKTQTAPGLALWPEVIVDQHFLKRQREARLISLVLDHPDLVGVGIDESTAVVVSGSVFEVIGKSSVVVFDARRANVAKAQPGDLAAATGVSMHVLKAGMRYVVDGRQSVVDSRHDSRWSKVNRP